MFVAKVVGQLDLHRPFEQPLRQPGEQAARPDELLLRLSPGEQLAAQFKGIRRLARHEPELFMVMGELALRSSRDAAIAAIFQDTIRAWHDTLVTLVRHAQKEGLADKRLDPDSTASLVIATLNGLFMVPVAGSASDRIDKALSQLESFLGLNKRSRAAR